METLNLILPLLRKGMWAASVDLQDAYLHIPIHPRHQRYLAFQYAGRRFTFRSLPFGLSTAPRVFTRVAGTVIAYLRKEGVTLYAYLDDWLIVGESKSNAAHNVQKTVQILQELGWIINQTKSQLTPTQTIQFLGARLDSTTGIASPSEQRIEAVRAATAQIISSQESPTGMWLRALGLISSLVDVVTLCRLRMRPLQLHLRKTANLLTLDQTAPIGRCHRPSTMVARHRQLRPRGPLHHQSAKHIGHDGRFIDRVGSPLEEPDSLGDVVHSRKVMAHQLNRDVGCQTVPRVVPRTPEKYSNHRLHGQYHRGSVHKQTRGHSLREVMSADLGSPDDSQGLRNDITSVPHRRKTKCDGRCSVQRTQTSGHCPRRHATGSSKSSANQWWTCLRRRRTPNSRSFAPDNSTPGRTTSTPCPSHGTIWRPTPSRRSA
ncbi:uncharacterized protein [Apostichopus japonicus]|uniref:uncharacterized protein n=1 Tax=Stichopus japonicus TaxID=307972 RepID=UPI003AB45134